jgi:cytochrome P450 family 313
MFLLELLLSGLLLLIGIAYSIYWSKRKRLYELAKRIPGSDGFPLLGCLPDFLKSPFNEYLNMFAKMNNENESIWKTWIGPKLSIYINSPECLQVVLNSPHCVQKPMFLYDTFEFIKEGLILKNGDEWKHHRKTLNTSFNLNVLQQLLPIFDEKSQISVKILEKYVDGEEFNIYDHAAGCTLESLMHGLLRYDQDCQSNPSEGDILKSINK